MSNPKITPVTAAGGIVFRYQADNPEPEVLMILRNGYWDLPKGKLEPPESIAMCAAREVAEEVGSSIPVLVHNIGTTYHEYPENGKTMGKTTHWYAMIFPRKEKLKPQQEEGIEKIEWFSLQEAIRNAGFDNLEEILKSFSGQIK